ncbi:hypothetical protein [Alienimonas californiensis]|uniref:Uncharacterized protein n=1 Tax=Alienimonas californiensis TaxID=2527989 RepID=A0A517P4G6_9PLAN|nr:hypothetical protein [Alienimonas californiensis]QDT14274.1 hypothetical protein CA12_03450 [Alienimonas californiensis]
MRRVAVSLAALLGLLTPNAADAGVGDPQVRTDHPWYPGELSCSTFERLEATQADLYRRVVGDVPSADEQKALAAWLWRNTHYWHGEEGVEDLWGEGFRQGGDSATRDYWTGLFAHGFGLCGTTHAQWSAELHALLGHNRGRTVGTAGHNSFEVFLKGGPYGDGRWALLDHDLSTVIFDREQDRLMSIADVQRDDRRLAKRSAAEAQRGWLVCGLHPDDGAVYADYRSAEYFPGYSGAPPMTHLRRGESLRRYLQPGLDDGKTFVFWGRNYQTAGIPGPERSRTWVNQPETMYGSEDGAEYRPGQARFANAVYVYEPDFRSGDYQEGVIAEDARQITFEFQTPYIIAATPPNDAAWGIYDAGCRNGLAVQGEAECETAISTDRGANWTACGRLTGRLDLTDQAKGFRQYWLRFSLPDAPADSNAPPGAVAATLADAGLKIITVCQANGSTIPRLRDGRTEIEFLASGRAVTSIGPTRPQADAHRIARDFGTPTVTLAAEAPRGRPAVAIHAAAHVASSNPPSPDVTYEIEYSADAGASWRPVVEDWRITRRGDEPGDFWSQSFCWGDVPLEEPTSGPLQVRFRNTGGKKYLRAEMHLVYEPPSRDATEVTFAWEDDGGEQTASHRFTGATGESQTWTLAAGRNVRTRWVEYRPVPSP